MFHENVHGADDSDNDDEDQNDDDHFACDPHDWLL